MDGIIPLAGTQYSVLGFKLTPAVAGRALLSGLVTTFGMWLLGKGKREANLSHMVSGAMLILVGLFVCF